jgi:hypothetical protein
MRDKPSVYEEQDGDEPRAQPVKDSGALASYMKQPVNEAREARPSRDRFI